MILSCSSCSTLWSSVVPIVRLFGSSVNGFGADDCDLDVAISFPNGEDSAPKTVHQMAEVFKEDGNIIVTNVVMATVLIAKFKYHHSNKAFNCDMSLDNDIAFVNSELLLTYSRIDDIIPMIGLLVKQWAKKKKICGHPFPSSHAWILMVEHYLQ